MKKTLSLVVMGAALAGGTYIAVKNGSVTTPQRVWTFKIQWPTVDFGTYTNWSILTATNVNGPWTAVPTNEYTLIGNDIWVTNKTNPQFWRGRLEGVMQQTNIHTL